MQIHPSLASTGTDLHDWKTWANPHHNHNNTGQVNPHPVPREWIGDEDEAEEELQERVRIAASKTLFRLEDGKWIEGKPTFDPVVWGIDPRTM